jgi:hypothetical protein
MTMNTSEERSNHINHCDGCFTYENTRNETDLCIVYWSNWGGECPCTVCIIKPMCQTSCIPFDEFRKLNSKRRRRGRNVET